jgi:hypothetical protein
LQYEWSSECWCIWGKCVSSMKKCIFISSENCNLKSCRLCRLSVQERLHRGFKKFIIRLLGTRFTNAISCFEPGPQEP